MTKVSKESILPLAGMLTGTAYYQEWLKILEDLKYREYDPTPRSKSKLTKKQAKARAKAKAARKARKRK